MMHLLSLFSLITAVLAATLTSRHTHDSKRALYFLDNDPEGSSIISLRVLSADGTLSDPTRTSTGGRGLYGLNAGVNGSAPVPGAADSLFSQDSVVVSGNYLFTVNAGSNTLSLFQIHYNDPTHPILLATVPTLGDFPVSVAYSSKLRTACVLNGGVHSGISCFSLSQTHALQPLGSLRPIPSTQTATPPTGPPFTSSDIVFSPSSTYLLATIKGSPTTPGTIIIYPIHNVDISRDPITTHLPGLLLDFSISFISDTRVLITDPAYGASILSISAGPGSTVTLDKKIVIENQKAICWSAFSDRLGLVYLMDAGQPIISAVDSMDGSAKGVIKLDAAGNGAFDAAVVGEWLFVLRGGRSVTTVKLGGIGGTEVKSLDLSAYGDRRGWMGMAVWQGED